MDCGRNYEPPERPTRLTLPPCGALPVAVTAFYGGLGPAVLATALGTVIGTYLFVGGPGWRGMDVVNITRVTLFVMIGLAVSFLGGRLQASRQSMVEANRRKDEFLAMLDHELRNPLASISAAAELLRRVPMKDQDAKPDEDRARGIDRQGSVDVIRRQSKSATDWSCLRLASPSTRAGRERRGRRGRSRGLKPTRPLRYLATMHDWCRWWPTFS